MDIRQRRAINQIAKSVLDVLNINSSPVPVENLPSMLGGSLVYEEVITAEERSIEAMIKKENNSFKIIISPDMPLNRQRFSIAHELGHLFIHMGYMIDEKKWNNSGDYRDSVYYRLGHNSEEHEAHEFAGALLMPEEEFNKIAKKYLSGGKFSLQPIADYFNVSVEAAKVRGQWLGIFKWG